MNTFGYGILVMVVGLAIVFTALVMLIILTKCLRVVNLFGKKQGTKKQETIQPQPKQVAISEPPKDTIIQKQTDQQEIIAVIAAAITAFGGEGAIIRSVRRVNNGNVWAHAGRTEQIAKRI